MDSSEPPSPRSLDTAAPVALTVDVVRRVPGWNRAVGDGALAEAAQAAYTLAGVQGEAEIALLLADDAEVRALNRTWRGKDAPTNVLAFPLDAPHRGTGPRTLGDIALAHETVAREAAERGIPLGQHAAHLVVHGVLHLLGHGHDDEAEARSMEALEVRVMAQLGYPDPYELEPAAAGDAR